MVAEMMLCTGLEVGYIHWERTDAKLQTAFLEPAANIVIWCSECHAALPGCGPLRRSWSEVRARMESLGFLVAAVLQCVKGLCTPWCLTQGCILAPSAQLLVCKAYWILGDKCWKRVGSALVEHVENLKLRWHVHKANDCSAGKRAERAITATCRSAYHVLATRHLMRHRTVSKPERRNRFRRHCLSRPFCYALDYK